MILKSKFITSVIVWAVILMMWAQVAISGNVKADDRHEGGYASGTTRIGGAAGCQASVHDVVMTIFVIVHEGDTVYYEFYVTYTDMRQSGPETTHSFTISIYYPGRPPSAYGKNYYTSSSADSGTDMFEYGVGNVDPPVTVSVYWHASISGDDCNPGDSDSGGGSHDYVSPP